MADEEKAANKTARTNNAGMEKPPWLSVVVIGRNEERRLPALFESLPRGDDIEWIYVDSDSADRSAAIASQYGARVYVVESDSVYAPGTGRYIGTGEAEGRWILYLDGDMVFRPEFDNFLDRLKAAEQSGRQAGSAGDLPGEPGPAALPGDTAGFVGRTCNRYLDERGSVIATRDCVALPGKVMGAAKSWGRPAGYHGGAVLYRRDRVLEAGSWTPAVLQLEEIDLYSRVRARGGTLRAVDLPMADHYTPYLTLGDKFKLNFLSRWRGKNLYGAGQVVAARAREGTLLQFIRAYPYPFIVLGGLLTAPLFYLLWPPLPLLTNAAIAVWLGLTGKWYYYLVYLGNLFQVFRGLGRYRPFVPGYRKF